MSSLSENANAVLLPAFASTSLSDATRRFLADGGRSILLGETRDEYVARAMSPARKAAESAAVIQGVADDARALAGDILVAVDQEIDGICRLHDLVPTLGSPVGGAADVEAQAAEIARAAKGMGVNCFLGPILDVLSGDNPWLAGRTWSTDPAEIAAVSSGFIRGVQSMGVAATAKHFPGHHNIPLDPAIEPAAVVDERAASFEPGFLPFAEAVRHGVEIIMVGPAPVTAFDPARAASISPTVIDLLKTRFGFGGVVLSDDLDSQATLRGRTVEAVAVDALNAGSDFLLLADTGDQIQRVAAAVEAAVHDGVVSAARLEAAATKVRALAATYDRAS